MSTQPEPDCGSSSCIFSAKGGMRTNGPCRCYENAGFHGSAVMAAKQMLREVLLLRGRLDAMPHDRTWTKDKPTPGEWWLSLAPEKRTFSHTDGIPAVRKCRVDIFHTPRPTKHCSYDGSTYWHRLDDDRFAGAQWKRVDPDPADPFAETQPSYSQDSDLP